MKHILKNLLFLIAISFVATSCYERELEILNPDANTTLTASETDLILSLTTVDDEALNLSWTEPDFGFDAAPTYKILFDFAGGDFTAPQTIIAGTALSKTLTVGELNSKMQALGTEANIANTIEIRILTILSDYEDILSDAVTVSITPYADLLDLSTTWGVVGSATPNGWDGPDIPFYQTGIDGVYTAYATLSTGDIKFREDNAWTLNYGDDGNDGSLEESGTNIPVEAGSYKITLNLNNLTWSMEAFAWGIVGSATTNGWDGPDVILNYDSFSDTFKAAVTLVAGDMKFRKNNAWDVNYGDTGADGTLEISGDNIVVEAGHYIVTLDFTDTDNPIYTIEATNLWGIVGDAAPNGWDGPNVKFTPDFGGNEGIFYLNGITLTDGEWKIRQNDAWDINYGDDGANESLELSGANITVVAGTYDITLDFSDPDNPTYTIQ